MYHVFSEIDNKGFVSVDTRVLFAAFDRGETVTIHCNKGSRIVPVFDYSYTTDLDFRRSLFKFEPTIRLDVFNLKLLQIVNHEWYNLLYDFFNSKPFIDSLSSISKVRKEKEFLPSKEDQLSIFKNRIKDVEIPDSLTLEEHSEIWKPLVNEAREKQKQYM